MLVLLGVQWYAEPTEQPADRHTLQEYDVDADVLSRWRETISPYLRARAALLREIERQGFRVPAQRPDAAGGYVDIVFDGPPGPDPPRFVEVEDDQRRSITFGEWVERPDGYWVFRVPAGHLPNLTVRG